MSEPSKAVNTTNPKYSKLTIGVCPDQWGVWFPDDPKQMAPARPGRRWPRPASR